MGKAKQSAMNNMDDMDVNQADAMTDQEREDLQRTLSESDKKGSGSKKSM